MQEKIGMYRKTPQEGEFPEIGLYFEGRLNPENRWVRMAERLPWKELEADYAKHFKSCGRGEVALNVRVAMGALLIKDILGLSDRGVVEAVSENPYLQYFLGFKRFQTDPPFNASLMTHFRKRLPSELVNHFNEKVIELAKKETAPDDDPPPDGGVDSSGAEQAKESENAGTILMDATCAPADIKYPTDLNLVNEARELTEILIDQLRKQQEKPPPRPRTKPQICRKRYLEIIKHPKCGVAKRRSALRFLLNSVRRNLEFIDDFRAQTDFIPETMREQITVIRRIHDQQREMLNRHSRRIEHRIVSLQQPHVRPIVRGKAGHETEFGAKLTASLQDGYARIERLSWEAYNEAGDLPTICERFKTRTGHYPEAVLADKLFRNRENLRYCAERGIRLSGPRLGRPAKVVDPELLKLQLADNSARNAIEGKFGQCKRRLGLDRVMARRKDCSETVIAIAILAANLIRWEQESIKLLQFCFQGMFFGNSCDENTVAFCLAA